MHGTVQYDPLLLSSILEFAADNSGDVAIVSKDADGEFRYSYREADHRARCLAWALQGLGIAEGSFVGSLGWTTYRHFELFYAVPGIGAILHTANPRLSPEQLAYTINVAGESIIFVDPDCVPQLQAALPHLLKVDTIVVMADQIDSGFPGIPTVLTYDEVIAQGSEDFTWPRFDERTGSTLCFTSGTSGNPKGVLYSHRGSFLSAMSIASPNYWGIGQTDCVLAIAPLFHCNGWAAPYLAPLSGAKLVLPGRSFDSQSLHDTIVSEAVTVATGVPTIWLDVLDYCQRNKKDLGVLNRIVCGGSAPPPALIRTMAESFAISTLQVWGMTETTHAATMRRTGRDVESPEWNAAPQGRPTFGTKLRIVNEAGEPLPKDGQSRGHLQVRANWCASEYLGRGDVALCDHEGWLNTGDVAVLSPDSQLRITDRIKDVIKSGGEWISSIDLENAAIDHDSVAEAAVIGVPHPRWQERPVLVVAAKTGKELSKESLFAFLSNRIPKWWLPDEIVMLEALPHSSTGKIQKSVLRDQFRDLLLKTNSNANS